MAKKNCKTNMWRRITAILLIQSLMTVLLWGCTDGINTPTQTETTAIPESELLDTPAKVQTFLEEMALAGATEFSLVCSDEIYDMLLKVTYKTETGERKAIHNLLDQTGLYDYFAIPAGMKKIIKIGNVSYYPGYEILRSVKAGTEGKLTSQLKKTLAEARAMADACRTPDPLETAKNIQSAICARTRYAYMTNQSKVDTAIGVLLNGTADCDGYADAFYLVGGLAGLEVQYQCGVSSNYDLDENKIITGSHMWNLLKLDGSWRVVDVCWADEEDGINYTWFNIGKDRASRSRTWQEALSVALLEATDLSTRPETEYSVTSRESLESAITTALEKEQLTFTIILDADTYGSRTEVFDVLWNHYSGEIFYYWDECTRAMTIFMEDGGEVS